MDLSYRVCEWRAVKVGIVLKGYRNSDLEAMYALDVACFARPFRFSRAAMRRFAEATNARVTIAGDGETLAGFGIMHVERVERGLAGYIVTLDVAAEYRRGGLGRRLIETMEALARAAECDALVLHVFVANEAAIRFYERCGFVRRYRVEGFYGRRLDAWLYSKRTEAS